MQDISSLTRDQTCAPLHWEFGVLTTRPLGESVFGVWGGGDGQITSWTLEGVYVAQLLSRKTKGKTLNLGCLACREALPCTLP